MLKLQQTKPVWHAVIWILIYIVLVNIGDALSEAIGVTNSATSALVIVLAAGLLLYVYRNGWAATYGLRWPRAAQVRQVGFYLPLALILGLQYFKEIDRSLSLTDIALIVVLMIGVGFIEELLFRGFLFRGILQNSSLTAAVLISGITFGIGHIVNLLRGYALADQGLQIAVAIALGVTLTLLVVVTGSILPGVVFHTLFNISGSAMNSDLGRGVPLVVAMIVISVGYSLYLWRWLPGQKVPAPAEAR